MTTPAPRFSTFKWAFSTLGCPELDLDGICALAREFGISNIELRSTEQRVDLPNLFEERFGSPESLSAYLKDQDIHICSLDSSLKLIGKEAKDREEFLAFLPWADAIGTPIIRVFDGGTVPVGLTDETFGQAADTLDWWREEKSRAVWKADMGIETHDALVRHSAIERILKSYPDLNIIWDTHHTWKKCGDLIPTSWDAVKSNVCNIHIKDSISKPSARHPFTYTDLGSGEFPLDETLELLQSQNYRGHVSIEWERMWHPYLGEMKEALQQAKQLNWF